LGLERLGGKCVFSAEIDKHACKMYELNYGENPYCDITALNPDIIPDFDILCAGFPCQPFSICGKQQGFLDKTRGTLFFDIVRILDRKKPKVFFLENVKNLAIHDNKKTLKTILNTLSELGYTVEYKILNAKDFGVPQNRERIIFVGSRDGIHFDFDKIVKAQTTAMKDYLDNKDFDYLDETEYTIIDSRFIKTQKNTGLRFVGYRNKNMRKNGIKPNTEHLSRVHRQCNRIYSTEGTSPTISSQEKSGRYFIYHNGRVRKITVDECYRFFGFPDDFKKTGKESALYERIGNSVCIPMIETVGKEIIKQILSK